MILTSSSHVLPRHGSFSWDGCYTWSPCGIRSQPGFCHQHNHHHHLRSSSYTYIVARLDIGGRTFLVINCFVVRLVTDPTLFVVHRSTEPGDERRREEIWTRGTFCSPSCRRFCTLRRSQACIEFPRGPRSSCHTLSCIDGRSPWKGWWTFFNFDSQWLWALFSLY